MLSLAHRQLPAFFEPGPVPSPGPALTAHTVIRFASAPPTITMHEEVRFKTSTSHPRTPTPEPKVRFGSASSFCRRSTTPSAHNGWGSSRESSTSSDDSDLTSLSSDSEEGESSIPKPPGESGRPKSGGYNLKHASCLKAFYNIKQYVADLVKDSSEVDTKKSFRSQKPNAFESIYEATQAKFPELRKFVNCWPIEDMLKNSLKNSSNKWRTAQRKKQLDLGLTKGQTKKDKKRGNSRKSP